MIAKKKNYTSFTLFFVLDTVMTHTIFKKLKVKNLIYHADAGEGKGTDVRIIN